MGTTRDTLGAADDNFRPHTIMTAGMVVVASPWAMLPPIVPMLLRTCGSAISLVASRKIGYLVNDNFGGFQLCLG